MSYNQLITCLPAGRSSIYLFFLLLLCVNIFLTRFLLLFYCPPNRDPKTPTASTAKEPSEQGAQIDLLIDRQDNCINLCEIKFSLTEYDFDKKTADNLNQKRRIFLAQTKTKKSVFITMISTFGVKGNGHYFSTAHNQLTMEILFERM